MGGTHRALRERSLFIIRRNCSPGHMERSGEKVPCHNGPDKRLRGGTFGTYDNRYGQLHCSGLFSTQKQNRQLCGKKQENRRRIGDQLVREQLRPKPSSDSNTHVLQALSLLVNQLPCTTQPTNAVLQPAILP
jgi:hypothetical protein